MSKTASRRLAKTSYQGHPKPESNLLIDRRARKLITALSAGNVLLTAALANIFDVSVQWLDKGHRKTCNYSPPCIYVGRKRGYRRDAVIAWLEIRAKNSRRGRRRRPPRG